MKSLSQRCSNNLKLKGYTLLVCILFVITLSSCSDNPLDPGNNNSFIFIDSSRFDWTEIVLYYGALNRPDIHIINENEQFLIDTDCFGTTSAVYHILNTSYRRIVLWPDNSLAINTIPGKGTFLITCTYDTPRTIKIWKWDGSNFNVFLEPDINGDITQNVCSYSFIDNENNMWVTTRKGAALKFDGDSVKIYDLRKDLPSNRTTLATDFAYNGSDFLKAFGAYTFSEPGYWEYSWCIYRFENDEWILEHEEIIRFNPKNQMFDPNSTLEYLRMGDDVTFTIYSKINDRIIRYQKNLLQLYDDAGSFNTHWDLSGINFQIGSSLRGLGGRDFNEMMLPIERRPNYYDRYYYYDGNTFSPELGFSAGAPFSKVEFFNDMIFHVNGDYPVTKINIGRKKK